MRIVTAEAGAGKVLTCSDVDGNSTWQDPSVGVSEIEDISSMRVIGNVTGSTATPAEVVVVREADSIASNDNDTTIPTSAAVKDYVDNSAVVYKSSFLSLPAAGGSISSAHLLSAVPDMVQVQLKCNSATGGFATGEIITLGSSWSYNSHGLGVEIDSTNVTFHIGANGLPVTSPNGIETVINNANKSSFDIKIIATIL